PADGNGLDGVVSLRCDADCDITLSEDGLPWRSTIIDNRSRAACKSLNRRIFIALGRCRSIFRLTTTNQEVASSSLCRAHQPPLARIRARAVAGQPPRRAVVRRTVLANE